MRSFIRLFALAIILSTALFWFTQGAHSGWTQRYVTRTDLDPVTGIEYPVKEMRFVPGVDFLGLSGLAAFIVFGSSFMFRRRRGIQREIPLSVEPLKSEPPADPNLSTQNNDNNDATDETAESEEKRLT